MSSIEVWWIGIALAMDCFAISVATGISSRKLLPGLMTTAILAFGIFQGGMFMAGYGGTSFFSEYFTIIGKWISVVLLVFLGTKMIWEDFHPQEKKHSGMLTYRNIPLLAIATSLDAMAVGISFSFIQNAGWHYMLCISAVIAFCSSFLSIMGMGIGILVGEKLHFPTSFIGGIILICIAIKTVVEHIANI